MSTQRNKDFKEQHLKCWASLPRCQAAINTRTEERSLLVPLVLLDGTSAHSISFQYGSPMLLVRC